MLSRAYERTKYQFISPPTLRLEVGEFLIEKVKIFSLPQAHELGHMVLRHLEDNPPNLIRDGVMVDDLYEMCEKEADAFASTLLAPVPILRELPIDSTEDIQLLCGLSCSASESDSANCNAAPR